MTKRRNSDDSHLHLLKRDDAPQRRSGEIFPGCPVQALGVSGEICFYIDTLGQLLELINHTQNQISTVFGGRGDLLVEHFPQSGAAWNGPRWNHEAAACAMVRACGEKGIWRPHGRIRGRGVWTDDEGGLVLHCGDEILFKGEWRRPGEIEGYVYPIERSIPRPLEEEWREAPAFEQLGDLLASWNWLRGDLDVHLLAGWICAAIFGGALDWRPAVWITGDAGTGKSTLQRVMRLVMGEGALLQSTDVTEASIRQFVGHSSIPILLDEFEAATDNRKGLAVIRLARQAASGGVVLRGGADHVGHDFHVRSAFAFSSILVPPLGDQDISRIALLELMPFERGKEKPVIDPLQLGRIGRELRRRILDQWSRLPETLALYRQALSEMGHDARGQDQYGTLLAMADLALHEETPAAERCGHWAERLSAAGIGEQTDQSTDWARMLNHLLGHRLDIGGGARYSVGRCIRAVARLSRDPDPGRAEEALAAHGLKVRGRGALARLVIANAHPNLAKLFHDTHWYGGGGRRGVWSQAVRRIPSARKTKPLHFDGVSSRAWEISLSAIPNLSDDDTAEAQSVVVPLGSDVLA